MPCQGERWCLQRVCVRDVGGFHVKIPCLYSYCKWVGGTGAAPALLFRIAATSCGQNHLTGERSVTVWRQVCVYTCVCQKSHIHQLDCKDLFLHLASNSTAFEHWKQAVVSLVINVCWLLDLICHFAVCIFALVCSPKFWLSDNQLYPCRVSQANAGLTFKLGWEWVWKAKSSCVQ